MRKFGLIGFPLGHSFSKQYFTEKFRREGIHDCIYDLYPLENISLLMDLIRQEKDLAGLNVTIPYKSDVIRFLDNISTEAKEIGAVNVIRINWNAGNVRLSGYNSDVTGIEESLKPFAGRNGLALVLGTGGSSKAVCYVLRKMGIDFVSVSRNPKPGMISYGEIDKLLLEKTGLIVNATPLGMFPKTGDKPLLNYDLLGIRHTLFDLVYNPEMTSFLSEGKKRGCRIITGLGMLYSQAEKSWEIWNKD